MAERALASRWRVRFIVRRLVGTRTAGIRARPEQFERWLRWGLQFRVDEFQVDQRSHVFALDSGAGGT
jgi:hypothetical protein